MKNIIIGTAGHIDHGKTTLIKALTGRETDRLKEEKQRGISIELGFTYFDMPSGRRAGIIDVPGHEKFIKNMLAGVIGIDIVALVIAADEGVMPQTKEHLDILNILGVKRGIVVITKADLVDKEWLELVKEDIKEHLIGTFLEKSPMIPVSSTKGMGIQEVIQTIDHLTEEVEERDVYETPRLPVDRSFTITGFGTVVTGTLLSGSFKVGDEVQVFPGNKISRVRSIQVHGDDTQGAYAGQRVAINLAGLKKNDVVRGDVIAPQDTMKSTMMVDVRLSLLKDSQRIIDNRTRLRLYLGTNEVLCRVVFLDRDQLTPGESCYAQLRLENEIVAKRGDKFIIRFYSPMMTIGGGELLEPNPPKRKRYDKNVIEELKIKEEGDPEDIIEKIIKDKSKDFPSLRDIAIHTVMPEDKVSYIVEALKKHNRVIYFKLLKDLHIIHRDYFEELRYNITMGLEKYHKENSLKMGMPKEELRSRYLKGIKAKLGERFINTLIENDILEQNNEFISLKGFEILFNPLQQSIKKAIEEDYLNHKFTPLKIEEVLSKLSNKDNDILEVFEALIDSNILISMKDGVVLHKTAYLESIQLVKAYIKNHGSITVSELRDILDTNRKYAVALLEDFDQNKITKRIEDTRVLY